MLGNFADVQQSIGPWEQFDERAKLRQANNFAEISLADFRAGGDVAHHREGRVSTAVLKSGERYEADVVVVGAGVQPEVTLARAAGLEVGERGGVVVDERLRASAPDVWAAGDIAEYRSVVHGGNRLRIEHWDVAETQGHTAGLSMLGRDQVHDVIPYFFSDLADWTSMEYIGPHVNLAAKLFALDPALSPAQVIDLIKRGATASDDGRIHLIDPKRSVELLGAGK